MHPVATLNVFFFNDTATTEIYTLSLHDALPISRAPSGWQRTATSSPASPRRCTGDRKSTRLNSSHQIISYAVFCLKKKKKKYRINSADLIIAPFRRTAANQVNTHTGNSDDPQKL